MAQVVLGVHLLRPGQRLFPVEALAAVGPSPHQPSGLIGDGAVSAVRELVVAVRGVAAHTLNHELLLTAVGHVQAITFDAPVGEVDAEQGLVAVHGGGDVQSAGGVLRVDDALPGRGVAVRKGEVAGIQERDLAGGIGRHRIGVRADEQDEGVHLFDGRQPPIIVARELLGVKGSRIGLYLIPGHLVGDVDHPVSVGVGRLLPRETGDVVGNGQALGALGVTRLVAAVLRVLPIEVGPGSGRGDLTGCVVTQCLARVHDGVGQIPAHIVLHNRTSTRSSCHESRNCEEQRARQDVHGALHTATSSPSTPTVTRPL